MDTAVLNVTELEPLNVAPERGDNLFFGFATAT